MYKFLAERILKIIITVRKKINTVREKINTEISHLPDILIEC